MYYLINPDQRRVILWREDIEEVKEYVCEVTREKEVETALKSLNAIITTDVYPTLLH